MSRLALGDSDDAEVGATSARGSLVALDSTTGLDLARKTVAATIGALNLDAIVWLGGLETGSFIDGIHANLDKGLAVGICVGAGDVGSPVTNGFAAGTPDAVLRAGAGRVDVEVSSGAIPVARIGDSQS